VAATLADPSLEQGVDAALLTHALELSRAMVTGQWVRQTARALVGAVCLAENIAWYPHGMSFYKALERDAMRTPRSGLKIAERMWATDEGAPARVPRLNVPASGVRLAFFHMVNNNVREGQAIYHPQQQSSATLLCAVRFTRCMNRSMVTRETTTATPWPAGPGPPTAAHATTPPNTEPHDSTTAHVTYRGGEMPGAHRSFFKRGRRYRTNMYTATSFTWRVADTFKKDVIWTFEFDATAGCKHVNLITENPFGELEFLFSPYSAFEVIDEPRRPGEAPGSGPYWSDSPATDPHRIRIRVEPDGKDVPLALPIAPWC